MNMKKVALLGSAAAVLAALTLTTTSQASPSPIKNVQLNKLIDNMENAIDNYSDIHVTAEVDQLTQGPNDQAPYNAHSSYDVTLLEQDGNFGGKQTIQTRDGEMIETSDGKQVLIYSPSLNQYVLDTISQPETKKERLQKAREGKDDKGQDVTTFRRNPVMLSGDVVDPMLFPQSDAHVLKHAKNVKIVGTDTLAGLPVVAVEASDFTKVNVSYDRLHLWVNPDTGIVVKEEAYQGDLKTYHAELTQVDLNQGLQGKTSAFKIVEPQGATRMTNN